MTDLYLVFDSIGAHLEALGIGSNPNPSISKIVSLTTEPHGIIFPTTK